jgi:hypothetical protein
MGGTVYFNTDQTHVKGYITWTEQNVNNTNNTSDVYVEMRMYRDNTGYTTYGTGNFYMTVNGNAVNHTSESYSITYNSNTLVDSGTVTVPHNSDGTKTITISYSGNGDSPFTITAGSFNVTLSAIPRQSSVTSSVSWTAGIQNLGVTLQTYSSSYHHTLTLEAQRPDGSWSIIATRANVGSSTTMTFTQTENTIAYQIIAGYENRPAKLYCDTYDSSGNHIGSQTVQSGYVYGATIAKMSSPSSANIGDTFNATIGPCYTGFTYTAVFTFGGFTKIFPITVPATSGANASVSISFTTDEQTVLYNQIPNANQGTGNFKITSQYNGVDVNDGAPAPAEDPNWTFYLNVADGSSNPSFGATFAYEDINSTTKGVTGDNTKIIQGLSIIQADFHNTDVATGINGALINYYQFTVDSNSIQKYVPNTAPSGPLTANAGSTLPVGDYYIRYTWVDANGESLPSPELHVNVASTGQQIVVTIPSKPSGVTSAKIYCSTTSGTETYQGSTTGTTYTINFNPSSSGATCPVLMAVSMGKTTSSIDTLLKVQAFDTRGNSTTQSVNVSVIPYTAPVVVTSADRENGFEANTDLTLSGSYSTVMVNGISKNSLTSVQYSYKQTTEPDSAYVTPTPNFSYTTSSGTLTGTTVILSLDQTIAWNVKIVVTDTMGSTSTVPLVVPKGIPAAFIDEAMNTFSVGMLPAHNNAIEVAGDYWANGNPVMVTQTKTFTPATAGAWYRIAQTPSSEATSFGTFEIDANSNSHHHYTVFDAGISYGRKPSLAVLGHTEYNSGSGANGAFFTNARIVYNTTYTGIMAYLEIYATQAISVTLNVRLRGGRGWTLLDPSTAGSQPTGYSLYQVLFTQGGGVLNVNGIDASDDANNIRGQFTTMRTQNASANLPTVGGVNYGYSAIVNFPVKTTSDFQLASRYDGTNGLFFRGSHDIGAVWNAWERIDTVVDSGSNANGYYVKYSSGLMICWQFISVTGQTWSSVPIAGSTYYYHAGIWTFPATFASNPVTFNNGDVGVAGPEHHYSFSNTTTQCSTEDGILGTSSTTWQSNLLAIGYWR